MQPFLDLGQVGDRQKVFRLLDEYYNLVISLGGSTSGEHGDGLARSYLNERLFGNKIYAAFKQIKAAFDPAGILNPGKVVNGPSPIENLRHSPDEKPTGGV